MPEALGRFFIAEIMKDDRRAAMIKWSDVDCSVDTEDGTLSQLIERFLLKEHDVFVPAVSDEGLADKFETVSFRDIRYANDAITELRAQLSTYDIRVRLE